MSPPKRLRVCVVGAGGREHALAVAMQRTADVVVCPGNAGMAALGVSCHNGRPEETGADLFVIGPEQPLVEGLADDLRSRGHLVFGPGADGARLEGSKAWMKEVLSSAGVPTAAFGAFTEADPAIEYLKSLSGPWVVKTDGLAAGKGVLVTDDLDEAARDVEAKLAGQAFGEAGRRVVIEEGLHGREVSLMAVCDGRNAFALAAAQDFKRVGDGDTGPNTGGMGAFSPVEVDAGAVVSTAITPTLQALQDRGIDFRGVLYAGLMLTAAGPKVLEFNVRFGDPETQVVLPRWSGDVAGTLKAAAAGHLDDVEAPGIHGDAAVCVVLAAPGYPTSPTTGGQVRGLHDAAAVPGVQLYSAGIGASSSDQTLITAGGRVLGVGATGTSIEVARSVAYDAAARVTWDGVTYRRDIAATT